MTAMHEEMHACTDEKQHDQNSIPGEHVGAVLVGQQQAGNGEEGDQDNARPRPPSSLAPRLHHSR